MPTAVNSFFDDDSDDESATDEVIGQEKASDATAADDSSEPPAKRAKTIFDDESDDEDKPRNVEESGKGSADDGGEQAEKGKVTFNPDDDDEEFDDDGAVIGKSASARYKASSGDGDSATKLKKQAPPSKLSVLRSMKLPQDTSIHMVKLPNLVGLATTAFDESTYDPEDEPSTASSMIRWRYKRTSNGRMMRDAVGNVLRESNARIVKWEDGSFTLHIGKEVLEVETLDDKAGNFAGLNGYLYLSQKATYPDRMEKDEDGNSASTGSTVLECLGPVTSRFLPRPSSLQSAAHKALTLKVRQQTLQRAKIAEYVTQHDPELLKAEKLKAENDLEKSRAKKERSPYGGGYNRPRMNRRSMEEDDRYYDSVNLRSLKEDEEDDFDYGEDEDESEDEGVTNKLAAMRAAKKSRSSTLKPALESDDDDDDDLVLDDDSDEEDEAPQRKGGAKSASRAFVDDDDDE